MIAHHRAVMNTERVSATLQELVIVRTSQITHCEYWLASPLELAERNA